MQTKSPLEFIEHFDSLIISSLTDKNKPYSSYAPFVTEGNRYYVCINSLQTDAKNLLNSKDASIMFIEDECEAKNSFERKRVTFDIEVLHISREDDKFIEIMTLFKEKFGEKASIYKQLNDFQLFEFRPISGKAIFGHDEALDYKDGRFI
jgi:putative heme iron utilization protein